MIRVVFAVVRTVRLGGQLDEDNPLAQLITEHRKRTGESYADLARRGGMGRSLVHALATTPVSAPPKPETLEKLAKALDLDVPTVTRAAQQAAGYHVYAETTPDSETRILIGNLSQLDPDERQEVASLVERFLRKHREDRGEP